MQVIFLEFLNECVLEQTAYGVKCLSRTAIAIEKVTKIKLPIDIIIIQIHSVNKAKILCATLITTVEKGKKVKQNYQTPGAFL